MGFREHYERLVEALRLLSADSEAQMAALPSHVRVPDELALTFEDCILMADQLFERSYLDAEQVEQLRAVQKALDELDQDEDAWTTQALKSDPRWRAVREAAKRALATLGEEEKRPRLWWLTYVPTENDTR